MKITMKIYRETLESFEAKNDVELYIPMVMIATAKRLYGEDEETFSCSIESMWNILTKSQKPLSKTKREELIELFKSYLGPDKIDDWSTEINLKPLEKDDDFILLSLSEAIKIFTEEKRFDRIAVTLAEVITTYSYMNGECIYMSKDELLKNSKDQYTNIDTTNSKTWFKNLTTKQLEELASNFVAFPEVEELLAKRHSNDNSPYNECLVDRRNFDIHIKKLEKMGIICKVQTKYGQYHNKVVFCRVEHKEVVKALYDRLEVHQEMAKNKTINDQEQPEQPIEVPQETPKQETPKRNKNVKSKGRRKGTRNDF